MYDLLCLKKDAIDAPQASQDLCFIIKLLNNQYRIGVFNTVIMMYRCHRINRFNGIIKNVNIHHCFFLF